MKKHLLIIACLSTSITLFGQWSNTSDNSTQGAVKLKEYLLFDADGDFTGGNYFTLQDHSTGNFLRLGYGFQNHLVIKSNGFVGVGTNSPGYSFEVEKNDADNNQEYLLGAFNHTSSSGGVYLGYVGNGTGVKQARARSGGNVDFALGTSVYKEAIVISNSSGDVGIGTDNLSISGTGITDLVIGNASSSHGIVINAKSSNDAILAFAQNATLASRIIYNNSSGSLSFYKPGQGNLFTVNDQEFQMKTSISLVGSLGDLISLYGDRVGQSNMYGFGIETNGGTLYNKAVSGYNWYINRNADQGTHAMMKLNNEELIVDGKILSEEVKVQVVNGPDYVFEEDYPLAFLEEIKAYITVNKHLPEVPSAKEMETNGINLSEMNMLLLKKVEELTLHLIEQNKRMESYESALKAQEQEIEKLKSK